MVLPWSFLGPGMRWQMESDYRFRLVGGYAASLVPDFYWRYPIVRSFYGLPRPHDASGRDQPVPARHRHRDGARQPGHGERLGRRAARRRLAGADDRGVLVYRRT